MTRERCVLCGEMIAADDPDAVEVGGGLAHEDCLTSWPFGGRAGRRRRAEREDDGLFGSQDPESAATGRAAFECSTAELQRQARAARRSKERRKAG